MEENYPLSNLKNYRVNIKLLPNSWYFYKKFKLS